MPRVISYTRFSSPKQAKGDSYRRQTEMAARWCRKNERVLDTDFVLEDLGVSGYSGANAKKGALRVLQRLCLDGKLEEGTVLLIEALDRLTRLPLPDAIELLLSLVNNGLTIVTLTDNRVWTKESLTNLEDFMMSVVTLYGGYRESNQKSVRLRDTFEAARSQLSTQPFGSAPGWLHRKSKGAPWEVDSAKAEAVKKVFELSAAGLGSKAIAEIANAESWPAPMRLNRTEGRWHAQMPGRILQSIAVLGQHEYRIRTYEAHSTHWKGVSTGIRVSNYYPQIVSDELWHRARASISTRSVAKRRDSHAYNIWSGLMYCGLCGAPLQRKQERDGYSRAQITCADRLAGITTCRTFSARDVDKKLLAHIYMHASEHMTESDLDSGLQKAAVIETQLKEKKAESEKIAYAITKTDGKIDSFILQAMEVDAELKQLTKALSDQQAQNSLSGDELVFDETFLTHAMKHLYSTDDESRIMRASLHLKLARIVETIWVWGYDVAVVKFKSKYTMPVGLEPKILPSRARPESKNHKPPKEKVYERPYLEQALTGRIAIPLPQRRNVQKKSRPKPYELVEEHVRQGSQSELRQQLK